MDKPIKILYCIPSLYNPGGMEKILTEKANWLSDNGYDVTILMTDNKNQPPFFQLLPKVKIKELPLNFDAEFSANIIKKTYYHYKKLHTYKRLLKNFIVENKFDIVISLCGKEIEFLSSLPTKTIAELHFSKEYKKQHLLTRKKGFLYKILGWFLTNKFVRSTKNINRLVVLTKEDEKEWLKTNKNVSQIYNFITPSIPDVEKQIDNDLKDSHRCIAVGGLYEVKGFDLLINAWSSIAKECPNWKLSIYGDGKLRQQLQKQIETLGLSDVVKLEGKSSNISKELRDSDIFILSSRYEGFALVLLEASEAGLPIVAFDCKTGPKEMIIHGKNGLLVEPENVEKLATTIIGLIKNPTIRMEYGKQSFNRAMDFYKETIMPKWVELFNFILQE